MTRRQLSLGAAAMLSLACTMHAQQVHQANAVALANLTWAGLRTSGCGTLPARRLPDATSAALPGALGASVEGIISHYPQAAGVIAAQWTDDLAPRGNLSVDAEAVGMSGGQGGVGLDVQALCRSYSSWQVRLLGNAEYSWSADPAERAGFAREAGGGIGLTLPNLGEHTISPILSLIVRQQVHVENYWRVSFIEAGSLDVDRKSMWAQPDTRPNVSVQTVLRSPYVGAGLLLERNDRRQWYNGATRRRVTAVLAYDDLPGIEHAATLSLRGTWQSLLPLAYSRELALAFSWNSF